MLKRASRHQVVLGASFLIALIALTTFILTYGPRQVQVDGAVWFAEDSVLPPDVGDELHLLWPIAGLKWGSTILESVELFDYHGVSIDAVQFLRANIGTSMVLGKLTSPSEAAKLNDLIDAAEVRGAKLKPNVAVPVVETDFIVISITVTKSPPTTPLRCKVHYRWFGIPFVIEYSVQGT